MAVLARNKVDHGVGACCVPKGHPKADYGWSNWTTTVSGK